jgi:hypothetical protein
MFLVAKNSIYEIKADVSRGREAENASLLWQVKRQCVKENSY